jgi:hypothetical protein
MARDLTDIIAERELDVLDSPGERVVLRVERPIKQESGEWGCSFQVAGPGRSYVRTAYGEDSVQALQLGFEMARIELLHSGWRMGWNETEMRGGSILRAILIPDEYVGPVEEALDQASRVWRESEDYGS